MRWEHNFDKKTLQRGLEIQKKGGVTFLHMDEEDDDSHLNALVDGCEVEIDWFPTKTDWVSVESFCNCQTEYECEHAAAAMVEFSLRNNPSPQLEKSVIALPAVENKWLSSLSEAAKPIAASPAPKKSLEEFLVYVLQINPSAWLVPVVVGFQTVRKLKTGNWGAPHNAVQDFTKLIGKEYVSAIDRPLLLDLLRLSPNSNFSFVPLECEEASNWIEQVVETGRCCWKVAQEKQILSRGEPLPASLGWKVDDSGKQIPLLTLSGEKTPMVLPLAHPCYVDESAMQLGRLNLSVPLALASAWLKGPALEPNAVEVVRQEMEKKIPVELPIPKPNILKQRVVEDAPTPCLTFYTTHPSGWTPHYFQTGPQRAIHATHLEFKYGEHRVESQDPRTTISKWNGHELVSIHRNKAAEEASIQVFLNAGFRTVRKLYYWIHSSDRIANWFSLPEEEDLINFIADTIPRLEKKGWVITYDPSFELLTVEPEAWYVDLEDRASGIDWFDAEVGVLINGQRVNLLPLLLDFLKKSSSKTLDNMLNNEITLRLPDGQKMVVPAERMRLLASTLLELFSKEPLSAKGKLQIPWIRAMELARLQEQDAWESNLPKILKKNVKQFANITDIPSVALPRQLQATLRPYQHQGLSWMQFLREMGLGAVLADDMGLGKTVQALAHILLEKEAGRLVEPCLIIAPTSVLYNWENEVQRFTPDLRVHVSHGPERKEFFDSFAEYDLIITSYPLLVRDGTLLAKKSFHIVVLDEAQFVRNHKTHAARIVRLLKAQQRIALTGTPLENNLDELWALFSFVSPGLLGDNALFRQLFRLPIEKGGNTQARHLLAQRIAPFMLRRTKDEVVQELPPKTEIVRHIELSDAQKDLYETVRAAMEKTVRDTIAEKGVARSHIIVLDALLKMRQVCCHPALLKLKAAEKVKESAKLDALRDMIVEMIAEGRKILLFSQFVSMLTLIEKIRITERKTSGCRLRSIWPKRFSVH